MAHPGDGITDATAVMQGYMDRSARDCRFEGLAAPSAGYALARVAVRGRPGDHPSRPLTMRARALLPFRAGRRR